MDQSESANRPPEAPVNNGAEVSGATNKFEAAPERTPGGETQVGGPAQNPVVVAPVNTQLPPIVAPPAATPQPVVTDDTPLAASDDEVIEQEWVQKAKSIVSQTKGDPFSQEKEVGRLQAEYIKKRYGKEIKLAND